MRTLEFNVDGQTLIKGNDFSGIIRGTKRYLKCSFKFLGSDWNRCKIAIVFKSGNKECAIALGNDRSCIVPDEVTDRTSFKLWAIGVRDGYKITTNKITVRQEE